MPDEVKKRGRPKKILTPEEIEAKRIEQNRRRNERHKASGYVAQKKYRATHPSKFYEPKLRIPVEKKILLQELLDRTGLTITELVANAVEKTYGVVLTDSLDKED